MSFYCGRLAENKLEMERNGIVYIGWKVNFGKQHAWQYVYTHDIKNLENYISMLIGLSLPTTYRGGVIEIHNFRN
jgi:hypothetical protein